MIKQFSLRWSKCYNKESTLLLYKKFEPILILLKTIKPTNLLKLNTSPNIAGSSFSMKMHTLPPTPPQDIWIGNMSSTPYKGPIRHLQKQLGKYNNIFLLEYLEDKFPYISKWTNDPNIDNEFSNTFWTNPQITKAQIKQLLKFRIGQYIGNTCKHLFWPTKCPNPNCEVCHLQEKDTWVHVLFKCNNHIIHGFIVQRYNKVVWEIHKLLLSNPITRCYTIMNAGKFMSSSPDNTVPH